MILGGGFINHRACLSTTFNQHFLYIHCYETVG